MHYLSCCIENHLNNRLKFVNKSIQLLNDRILKADLGNKIRGMNPRY